jgi:Peptidase family M23
MSTRGLAFRSLALCASLGTFAAPATAQQGPLQLTPLTAEVLAAPQAVLGSDGAEHLVYEVLIENTTGGRFSLKRLAITDDGGTPLAELDAQAIGARLSLGGRRGSETTVLDAFQFAVAFLHVRLPANAPLPSHLLHVIDGHSDKANADFSMRIAPTRVVTGEPTVLAAPLHGHGYVAADGCCDSIRHVRALLTLNGRFYLAQRFAIDWERVDDAARLLVGDPKSVSSYKIYNDPVYAVADGTVIASRNDLDDQVPGKLPEGLPLDEADGNFAILELAKGVYALYAHMRKGTVALAAGAHVRQGEQIGNVGNSGNTQAPHLHFQLMDSPSALLANGLPYVFDHFLVTAVDLAGTADFDRAEATGTALALTPQGTPLHGQRSLPLDLSVVTWH